MLSKKLQKPTCELPGSLLIVDYQYRAIWKGFQYAASCPSTVGVIYVPLLLRSCPVTGKCSDTAIYMQLSERQQLAAFNKVLNLKTLAYFFSPASWSLWAFDINKEQELEGTL